MPRPGRRSRSTPSTRRAACWASRSSSIIEDDQTTNPGIVLAFSKLAAQEDIVAFLGSIRSTQVHAMAPDVLKLGKPVMIGGTDPALTHMGNQWLFRFRPNDTYSGRVHRRLRRQHARQEEMGHRALDRRLRHGRRQALAEALGKSGATIALDQGYANQSQDFTPGRARGASSRAPTSSAPISPSRTISACSRASFGSSASTSPMWARPRSSTSRRSSLPVPRSTARSAVADYAEESSEAAKAFGKLYRELAKVAPDDQASWPYDAVNMLVGRDQQGRHRPTPRIREAILATKGYRGRRGRIQFRRQWRRSARLQHRARTRRATSTSTSTSNSPIDRRIASPRRRAVVCRRDTCRTVSTWTSPSSSSSPASASGPSTPSWRSASC